MPDADKPSVTPADAGTAGRKSTVRGSLRLDVSPSTPAITSGSNFSIFVTIQNPFDVPITVYQVVTHIPVELFDVNSLRIYKANKPKTPTAFWDFVDRIFRTDIEKSQSGVAIAAGPEFSPEVEKQLISVTTAVDRMGDNSSIVGIAFQFPQNPKPEDLDRIYLRLEGMRKGIIPTTLQPGDTLVRQFVLRTRHTLFFTPLTYVFKIQVNYSMDDLDHFDTVNYNMNIRSSMMSVSVGAIIGALMGALIRTLSPTNPTSFGVLGAMQTGVVSIVASLAVVIAFARKASAQPIVSVEDVWGGALIGFSVGFFGFDKFNYLFANPGH